MPTTALAYALLASIVPSFVWLAFWLREDSLHPEPRWLILLVFLAGGIAFKIISCLIGIAGAIALHAFFNLSIINADAADALKTFMWIWAAVVILIILFEEIKVVRPRPA